MEGVIDSEGGNDTTEGFFGICLILFAGGVISSGSPALAMFVLLDAGATEASFPGGAAMACSVRRKKILI